MSRSLSVVLAVLLVLAGCGGAGPSATTADPNETSVTPTVDPASTADAPPETTGTGRTATPSGRTTATEPTTTADADRDVNVSGGSLPEDPNVMFDRVRTITGLDGRPPRRIDVSGPSAFEAYSSDRETVEVYLGFEPVDAHVLGFSSPGEVVLNESMGPTETEVVLAHELYHVLWYQQDSEVYEGFRNRLGGENVLFFTVIEASADYVEQRYWREYVKPRGTAPAAELRRGYRNGTPAERHLSGRSYFGYRYVDHRIDSARNLTDVYENPPRTTEELIHLLAPGSEPPTPLSVTGEAGQQWSPNESLSPTTKGELFVRHALQVGVNDSAAARGADGWGNDELLTYDRANDSAKGYVWVLRFDDAANATEFRRVFETALANRGQSDGTVWTVDEDERTVAFRVVVVDDRTVALAFGPRPFASNATVDAATNGTIAVTGG